MEKPDLTPNSVEKINKIYEYYENDFEVKNFDRVIQNLGFFAAKLFYGRRVIFDEDAQEAIEDYKADGRALFCLANHQDNVDVPTFAGLVRNETFADLKGKTAIPSKVDIFRKPALRRIFEDMNAIPTYRSQDFSNYDDGELLQETATKRLIDYMVYHVDNGGHAAIFPEATRNKADPRIIQPFKTGFIRIAEGAQRDKVFVPLGFSYLLDRPIKHSPTIYVGEPINPDGMTSDEMMNITHEKIQQAVDRSFAITDSLKKD